MPGLFFLGGSSESDDDDGSEFRYGDDNIRVRLRTSSQGFVFGVGRKSVSILRITMRFTVDFMNGEGFGLNAEGEGVETTCKENPAQSKMDGNHHKEAEGMEGEKSRPEKQEGKHSLSLSLIMTMTIVAVNTTTLS